MGFITGIIIGFILGFLYKKSQKEEVKKDKIIKRMTYIERQKAKVMYENDADRIRELNLLSPNEAKFMRILQREFLNEHVIVKNRRFYIADKDNYPIAIFEYRDGNKELKSNDLEDGIPLFLYKAILSSKHIKEDQEKIFKK
ncbi:hypothetical protein MKL32_10035 [Acinetobacter sp. AOR34_HL]|uniref:hypothetical protein n=1 Tax=Acinetobacter sp. AOR34_HL TaxID=2919384 RepID=UPI0022EADC6C|nr:hypothetical protein [Acinetobacter sp. AOR34_HL]MDA3501915.1 hypothetical protein [Acinetobacter sp. AOR34_HL]